MEIVTTLVAAKIIDILHSTTEELNYLEKAMVRMKATAKAAIIIAAILLFGFVGEVFSYSQTTGRVGDVTFENLVFRTPSAQTILQISAGLVTGNYLAFVLSLVQGVHLAISVELTNNGILPIYVPSQSHDVYVNNILVGSGSSSVSALILPSQSYNLTIDETIFTTIDFGQLALSLVQSNGVATVQIIGRSSFLVFQIPFVLSTNVPLTQILLQKARQLIQSAP